jgi:3-phosphoshikimate 1-carboxyvinyltransferase
MDYVIEPADVLGGVVEAPASKSYTIRAVLCALLAEGKSNILSPLKSRDTLAAFNACKALGALIEDDGGECGIRGVGGNIRAPEGPVDTLNSGTTIRLCTGISALCVKPITLTGDESVRGRPIMPLLKALSQIGASYEADGGHPPHTVWGPLNGGFCEIPGDVSSQFISAILMAAPYAKSDVEISVRGAVKSRPYLDLTINILLEFGVKVYNDGYRLLNVPIQEYRPTEYAVEGDYSSGAFLLAAAAMTQSDVTVKNLMGDSLQADKKIVQILSEMGADIRVGEDEIRVVGDGRLSGVTVDLGDAPDLVPIFSALAAVANGESRIVNTEHARLKECDRIHAMAVELTKMGAKIREKSDGLIIQGGGLKGANVDGWKDHRIIMSLAIAALKAKGKTTVNGAQHVDVTFPTFQNTMNNMGANIR